MIQLLAASVPNNKQLIVTKLMEEAAQLAQKATSELRALAQVHPQKPGIVTSIEARTCFA